MKLTLTPLCFEKTLWNHKMIPIFVISMKNSKERRDSISKQLEFMGLKFSFFDAINGYTLDATFNQLVDNQNAKHVWGKELTAGEIGCALSHIEIYKKIVRDNIKKAIIIEDDAKLHFFFRKIIENILLRDKSDLVFLHHGKAKYWPIYRKLPEGYRFVSYRRPSKKSKRAIFSAAAYIITKHGAETLIKHGLPIRMPADFLTGRPQLHRLRCSGVEPSCVDSGWFDTTIHGRY